MRIFAIIILFILSCGSETITVPPQETKKEDEYFCSELIEIQYKKCVPFSTVALIDMVQTCVDINMEDWQIIYINKPRDCLNYCDYISFKCCTNK